MTDLLHESKLTIIQLQHEIEALKSETEILRQQNRDYASKMESLQNDSRLKSANGQPQINSSDNELKATLAASKEESVPIPLEPIIIVKENKSNGSLKLSPEMNAKHEHHDRGLVDPLNRYLEMKNDDNSLMSDQTTQSENTFVM